MFASKKIASALAATFLLSPLISCGGNASESDQAANTGTHAPSDAPSDAPVHAPLNALKNGLDNPQTVQAMNRAVGLMGQFEFSAAAEAFDQIIRQANPPSNAPAEAILDRAIAILNQSRDGAQDDAIEQLRAFLSTNPSKELALRARYAIGLCELYLGHPSAAAPNFAEVSAAHPNDAYAQYFVAQALEQSGEVAKALPAYVRAAELDPYLKSAQLGIQRCARKSGDDARAERALESFEKLAQNPRAHNAEFKYTRMGDMGLAVLPAVPTRALPKPKSGAFFAQPQEMQLDQPLEFPWSNDVAQHAASVDLNGDGLLDLVLVRAVMRPNAAGTMDASTLVLLATKNHAFHPEPDHAIARLAGALVNSILFGDIDGDGRVDAYICRTGRNLFLLQNEHGDFYDATERWNAAGPSGSCSDGALADLDHDGDLDLLLLYRDAPIELLANTGNASFRAIGEQSGLAAEQHAPISVVVGDFDYDRDADILILNQVPPHQLFLNDRLWKWTPGTAPGISADQLLDMASSAAIVEIADLPLRRAVFASAGYLRLANRVAPMKVNRAVEVGACDITGDGQTDLMVFGMDYIAMHDESGRLVQEFAVPPLAFRTQLVTLDPTRGAHLITLRNGASPLLWEPGPARGSFAAISFSGRIDPSQSMRSNISGIGTAYAARIGTQWAGGEMFRLQTGRSQSLAPVSVGIGAASQIDLLEVDWSDGVLQSELDLTAGATHALVETQRQISSCPVLFAWNGSEQRFVTDLLGVAGLGFLLEPGVYSDPRPVESFVMPIDALVAKPDGTLSISIGEPMEESCMLDGVRLRAIDLPKGWDIAPDERMAIGGAAPTSELVAWRNAWLPQGIPALAQVDLLASDIGQVDERFIGRLEGEQVIELEFATAIDAIADPWLVIDGWIEYPYCQTMFAAWQAGAKYRAPNLEARAADGSWKEVVGEWGYPAGMPRRMALPIPRSALPAGTTALRMRTNMEIYFDSVRLVAREPLPTQPLELPLARATLSSPGFAARTTGPQRQPFYDHANARPLWDCRFQRGLYTEFGNVAELLARADGAPVVFGPGEEISIEFGSAAQSPPSDTTRRYWLEVRGWCKDMDLFTRDGETIEPMPGSPVDAAATELLRKSRIRPAGGR